MLCCHLQTTLLLKNNSWPAIGSLWKLDAWPWSTRSPCELSCVWWPRYYLIHQLTKLDVHSDSPSLNGNHTFVTKSVGSEGTSKLYEQVSQISMVSTYTILPSVSKHFGFVRCIISCWRTRELGPNIWMALHIIQLPLTNGELQHDSTFLRHLWRT